MVEFGGLGGMMDCGMSRSDKVLLGADLSCGGCSEEGTL